MYTRACSKREYFVGVAVGVVVVVTVDDFLAVGEGVPVRVGAGVAVSDGDSVGLAGSG